MTMPEPRERRDAPGVINLADEAATAELAKTVASVSRPGDVIALWGDLGALEEEHIRTVLQATGGNKSRAAAILGIERKTLYRKLERMQSGSQRAP